jgi:hypothetical protein
MSSPPGKSNGAWTKASIYRKIIIQDTVKTGILVLQPAFSNQFLFRITEFFTKNLIYGIFIALF